MERWRTFLWVLGGIVWVESGVFFCVEGFAPGDGICFCEEEFAPEGSCAFFWFGGGIFFFWDEEFAPGFVDCLVLDLWELAAGEFPSLSFFWRFPGGIASLLTTVLSAERLRCSCGEGGRRIVRGRGGVSWRSMTGETLLLPGLLASGRLVVDSGLYLSCWSRFWSNFSIVLKVC